MPKVLIEVRGGLVQDIISTSSDVEIFVFDHDTAETDAPAGEEAGWQYWEAKGGDRVVDETTFKDAIVNINA